MRCRILISGMCVFVIAGLNFMPATNGQPKGNRTANNSEPLQEGSGKKDKTPSPVPVVPLPPPREREPSVLPPATSAPFGPMSIPDDPPYPIVSIQVRVAACAAAGEEISYRIRVRNFSNAAAHHVLVRNPLPKNAEFVRAEPKPKMSKKELLWVLGTIPGCGCREIRLVLRPTTEEDVTNCARVQFEHGQCTITRIAKLTPETAPKVKTKSGGKEQPGKKNLSRLKLSVIGPLKATVDAPTTYTITVHNEGVGPATNVLLGVPKPANLDYIRSSKGGRYYAEQAAWLLGTIASGRAKIVTITFKANAPGKICIKPFTYDDSGRDSSAEFCTVFRKGAAGSSFVAVNTKGPVAVGEQTSYRLEVRNQSKVPIKNIEIKATLPAGKMKFVRFDGPAQIKQGGAVKTGETIHISNVAPLAPGKTVRFEIHVEALQAGDARFHAELTADHLRTGGPVREEEATTIFNPE